MIKLIKSSFYHEEEAKKKLADFIMSADILSMNEECRKYEKTFAQKQGQAFAVFVSSGSMANLVLIQALLNLGRLKPGDKVGFSALTWATNVMPIIQLGLVPVAIDCEVETLNISPNTLEPHLGELQGLFLTNVLGFSDDIQKISEMCSKNNIIFLEDNCESLGSKAYGKLLGNFGAASTFSSFVGHHFSTIEGGMICTDDEELNDMLLMIRAHGWDRNLSEEKQQELRRTHNIDDFLARYTFYDLAYNARPTEINGFLGNEQIQYWDEIVQKRGDNFNRFQQALSDNKDLMDLKVDHMEIVSNFAMPLIAKNEETFKKYKNRFEKSEVEIRPIIAGDITKQPFYQKYTLDRTQCPHASFIHSHGFYFGNNPEMTSDEVDTLCDLIQQ